MAGRVSRPPGCHAGLWSGEETTAQGRPAAASTAGQPRQPPAENSPPPPYASRKSLTRKQRRRVGRIKKAIRIWLGKGYVTRTEKLLRRSDVKVLFDRYEFSEARAKVAAAWFHQGNDKRAYRFAKRSIAGAGKRLPMTHWTAGLAAWRLGRFEDSARHFSTLANTASVGSWNIAGASYWAARANGRLERDDEARRWLRAAARHPHTLYGQLAHTSLGMDGFEHAKPPKLTSAMVQRMQAFPQGRRALALIQVGQTACAEQELLAYSGWRKAPVAEAILALAQRVNMPALAVKIAQREAKENTGSPGSGDALTAGLFPIPPWSADATPAVDRALLFAFMRQESDFNVFAESLMGARGLMQIMPGTAKGIAHQVRRKRSERPDLFDPDQNLALGDSYIIRLLNVPAIRGNLVKLIASYNGGIGNVIYWQKNLMRYNRDPLLYIETLPMLETRLFVRRVLANFWIYRQRLRQPVPSLTAMARGNWPRYRQQDGARALEPMRRP